MKRKMTLLIVDDEPLARRKIRSFALEACGFEIVAEAENGEEAWSALLRIQPDIVVTDIGMPVMDGLALLRHIRASGRTTKVLMLTCYEDFDKAKHALKLGASDYMTKLLLDEREFIDSLNRIAKTIDQEEQMARAMWRQRLQEAAERSVTGLEAAYGTDRPPAYLLGGMRLSSQLCEQLGRQQDQWSQADGRRVLFRLRPQLWAILFCAERHYRHSDWLQGVQGQLHELVGHLKGNTSREACEQECDQPLELTVALTTPFYDLNRLAQMVGDLHRRLDDAFYMATDEFHHAWNTGAPTPRPLMDTAALAQLSQQINRAVLDRDILLLRNQIEEWLRVASLIRPVPVQAQLMADTMMAMSYPVSVSGSGRDGCLFSPAFEHEAVHITQLRQRLLAWLQHLEREWAQEPASLRQEIRKAMRYVQQHYDEALDLQQVARHVVLSPTWFGTLFRAQTGQSFHEYVTRFRLERARELLMTTDLKVYEVAQQVGIPNARYFSRLFTDFYTVRPLDCRKSASDRSGVHVRTGCAFRRLLGGLNALSSQPKTDLQFVGFHLDAFCF